MFLDGFQSLSDFRVEARIHERDAPIRNIAAQQLEPLAATGKHEVVRFL
jgi:hypothetical protein